MQIVQDSRLQLPGSMHWSMQTRPTRMVLHMLICTASLSITPRARAAGAAHLRSKRPRPASTAHTAAQSYLVESSLSSSTTRAVRAISAGPEHGWPSPGGLLGASLGIRFRAVKAATL